MKTLQSRFWDKVDLWFGITDEDCWNWKGAMDPRGYGRFWHNDRLVLAHHFLVLDTKPTGLHALHHCDNPRCVNPRHIFFGTALDNARDRDLKGRNRNMIGWQKVSATWRHKQGELNGNSKLTQRDILQIRSYPKSRGLATRLAVCYGVHRETVRMILRGARWAATGQATTKLEILQAIKDAQQGEQLKKDQLPVGGSLASN